MPSLHDKEFGEVTIRRTKQAKNIKLSIAPNGSLRISMPAYAPLFMAKRLLASSRKNIRNMLSSHTVLEYEDGMRIGKSHTLVTVAGSKLAVRRSGQIIQVTLPAEFSLNHAEVRKAVQPAVLTALRKEAKSYLPRRLAFLAAKHGFSYSSVRFSHASTRWGSCSSQGTISLNIALMMLDFALIDYVLLHELCHTRQMNHSPHFWKLLESVDEQAQQHRWQLKSMNPTIL